MGRTEEVAQALVVGVDKAFGDTAQVSRRPLRALVKQVSLSARCARGSRARGIRAGTWSAQWGSGGMRIRRAHG